MLISAALALRPGNSRRMPASTASISIPHGVGDHADVDHVDDLAELVAIPLVLVLSGG